MAGGQDYIKDKKWDIGSGGKVDLSKVYHINNGVDLEAFNINKISNHFKDEDLDTNLYKVIYTGSIRKANNVKKIIDTASFISEIDKSIKFIIYGEGNEKTQLIKYAKDNGISNVVFKDKVDKKKCTIYLVKS